MTDQRQNDGFRDGDYTKAFFQKAWGPDGYFEDFSYGVGIDKVTARALFPFVNENKTALEIGSGGGSFTRRMYGLFGRLIAIDVIPRPASFTGVEPYFSYIELADQCFQCSGVAGQSIDFIFSYNVFCHLSDVALDEYFTDIARVARPGADFVFMLSNYEKVSQLYFPDKAADFTRGQMCPNGHFYQDALTVQWLTHPELWLIVDDNMIPEHRDRIVHLRRRYS